MILLLLIVSTEAFAAPKFSLKNFQDTSVIITWRYSKSYSRQVKRACLQKKIFGRYVSIYCAKANKLSVRLLDAVNMSGQIDYRLVINKKNGSDKFHRKIVISLEESSDSDSLVDDIINGNNNDNSEVSFTSACPIGLADEMISLINQVRIVNGLNALVYSSRLALAADWHARSNAMNKVLTHDGWIQRINDSGFKYRSISQNIAAAVDGTKLDVLVNMWINSPGHRQNILDSKMTATGVSCAKGENGIVYWAQNFGLPR